jgi:hypothetical protein
MASKYLTQVNFGVKSPQIVLQIQNYDISCSIGWDKASPNYLEIRLKMMYGGKLSKFISMNHILAELLQILRWRSLENWWFSNVGGDGQQRLDV